MRNIYVESERLNYFSDRKKIDKRFYCQPALNLFEYFIVFKGTPYDRYDIIKALDLYFNKKTEELPHLGENTEPGFNSISATWNRVNKNHQEGTAAVEIKTAVFPALTEYVMGNYDMWQLKFIYKLCQHQVEERYGLNILRQITCDRLKEVYHNAETLSGALRILRKHIFLSAGPHNLTAIRQSDFLFFKDYLKAVYFNVNRQIESRALDVDAKQRMFHKQLENGLSINTKEWINARSAEGMAWNRIIEYIDVKESHIATSIIKERDNRSLDETDIKASSTESTLSATAQQDPAEMYCTHHRINTHNTKDCYILNSKAKKNMASLLVCMKYTCQRTGCTDCKKHIKGQYLSCLYRIL